TVRYAYKEDYYTYKGFEKEVKKSSGKVDEFFHLDLNISQGHTHTVATDGFFQWVPNNVEEVTNTTEVDSVELLVKPIHVYLRPIYIKDDTGKIIEGTQNKKPIHHTTEDYWFNELDYKYD